MLTALRARRLNAVELLRLHQERMARLNPILNAVVSPNPAAEQEALAADQARALGHEAPLLGLPVTVKDCIAVAGLLSTVGDPALRDNIAHEDAPTVAALRRAGAVILGKTNMAPWGGHFFTDNALFGRSANLWNMAYTPGGSTGGGAAAVAAGLSPLELGSDLGGSVRIPAAFCGLYGHRPSEGLMPRTGAMPKRESAMLPHPLALMSVPGPLARSAEDLELALQVLAGPEMGEEPAWSVRLPGSRSERLTDFRVAVMPLPAWLPVDDELLAAQERLAGWLSGSSGRVKTACPEPLNDLIAYHSLFVTYTAALTTQSLPAEARRAYAARLRAESDDPLTKARARGAELDAAGLFALLAQRERYRAAWRAFFREYDILLTPPTLRPAFRHDEAPRADDAHPTISVNGKPVPYGWLAILPAVASTCGLPATVLPFGRNAAGLPLGVQLIGPYLEDRTPLRLAGMLVRHHGAFTPPLGWA
jgi:amidase